MLYSVIWSGFCAALVLGDAVTPDLPVVDLGYELHQAILFNKDQGFYNFSNIRYAQPPLGQLRFTAPKPVEGHSNNVNNGSIGVICPQAIAAWNSGSNAFVQAYTHGVPFAKAAMLGEQAQQNAKIPPLDPRTTEDCLFLDIFVPKKVFDGRGSGMKAPVYLWIHGGGYKQGDKTGDSNVLINPSAVLQQSNDTLIFVSINYRLGAFGWLAGPLFEYSGGLPNNGLHDQRLAMDWVQQYIHLFGGDKSRVTVAGESAGAGSIVHHLTAFGGQGDVLPFTQAVAQSPAFSINSNLDTQNQRFQEFLDLLGVGSLDEARTLPSEQLIMANQMQAFNSSYGGGIYGVTVDGTYVPAQPGLLFENGSFHQNVNIYAGHNVDEGLVFTNPLLMLSGTYPQLLQSLFTNLTAGEMTFIESSLYPPIFDGSYGYANEFERASTTLADVGIVCNVDYMGRAYNNATYSCEFSVYPGIHGQDLAYEFNSTGAINQTVASAFQAYISSFVDTGIPAGQNLPPIPQYGLDAMTMNLTTTGIEIVTPAKIDRERCAFWQNLL
ncbi:Alpha/Beta hydrolase protein [Trichoderma sp. SZMC 28015]